MNDLKLKIEKSPILGKFELKNLNLLFVFQVNCPGCFLYGFPLMEKLREQKRFKEISFMGLSTAFEDFDKNNLENTTQLISDGILVGETKKALTSYNYDKLPYPLNFAIFMDQKIDSQEEIEELVKTICHSNPNYQIWPEFEQEAMTNNVRAYLSSRQSIHYTFHANSFRGTPTFVLFNNKYEIKERWFGHLDFEQIENLILNHLTIS